jgi:dihydroorotate dehydrogenase
MSPDNHRVTTKERSGTTLHSSWHWDTLSDKSLDAWMVHIRRIKDAYPTRVVVASILAEMTDDTSLREWRLLAEGCQEAGADALECNFAASSAISSSDAPRSLVVEAVREVASVPVWAKLALVGRDAASEADACFRSGAAAVVSSNTIPSLPIIDPDTLEFEVNVDGFVSRGGLGGPAILPLSLHAMACMCNAFPTQAFCGVGGISEFSQALSYFLLGAGLVQVGTAAMLDQAVGPTVIRRLNVGLDTFLSRNAEKGWNCVDDFRGLRRERVVDAAQIRRVAAEQSANTRQGREGYAPPEPGVRA